MLSIMPGKAFIPRADTKEGDDNAEATQSNEL